MKRVISFKKFEFIELLSQISDWLTCWHHSWRHCSAYS